jgi:hypothetical protein
MKYLCLCRWLPNEGKADVTIGCSRLAVYFAQSYAEKAVAWGFEQLFVNKSEIFLVIA